MSELFLIAHKVRGEPAFDVATQTKCPECSAQGCIECDDLGYWWVVPTSGHRAYPYAHKSCEWDLLSVGLPPEGLPDHYQTSAAPKAPPKAPPKGIANLLAEARRKAAPIIDRRGF